ncbi:LPXTG cell wall anchor domain-containing protein [Loigolactobacillus zhaoyuanensis]|uniref:LPXTG cell wall anchor domain-containing protein n=1 Tax=Loigolactobacillus zhaoyuanensis TaxID=2486017 RepID=A0ABW8UEV7_9LACO
MNARKLVLYLLLAAALLLPGTASYAAINSQAQTSFVPSPIVKPNVPNQVKGPNDVQSNNIQGNIQTVLPQTNGQTSWGLTLLGSVLLFGLAGFMFRNKLMQHKLN